MTLKTAGHVEEKLFADPGINRCGKIKDGIAFWHGNEGGWVVSMADLRRLMREAERERPPVRAKRLRGSLGGDAAAVRAK